MISILLFAALLILILNLGCATVNVKNVRFCGDKGEQGAVCDWTLGGPTEHLSKPVWDEARLGMACTDMDSVTSILGVIKKLCFDSRRCTYDERREIEALIIRVMEISESQ